MKKPLIGKRIVSLAVNLPGPLAMRELKSLGAEIIKVESPDGDPLKKARPEYYKLLTHNQKVRTLDLKTDDGFKALKTFLKGAHLLVTSSRPRSLKRLGLDAKKVKQQFPRLNQIRILGYDGAKADQPGHDLTFQAEQGLIKPPQMPRVCWADTAGAIEVVKLAVIRLLNRSKTGSVDDVVLSKSLGFYLEPTRQGLTGPGSVLGGALPNYCLYETQNGWIALAALEPQFLNRLKAELNLQNTSQETLKQVFSTRSAGDWQSWANDKDLPIVEVKELR